MDSKKTSKKQKGSLVKLTAWKPNTKNLGDRKLIAETLVRCLFENDIEAFEDVLVAYLKTTSKTELAKTTGIGRQTIYDLMGGKEFNPTLKTIAPLLKALKKAA